MRSKDIRHRDVFSRGKVGREEQGGRAGSGHAAVHRVGAKCDERQSATVMAVIARVTAEGSS